MDTISPQVLATARKYKSSAVTSLLESYAPLVHRLSSVLCSDGTMAANTTAIVLRRAIRMLPKWRDDSEADRWFYHYTVLETRRSAPIPGGPGGMPVSPNPLTEAGGRTDPAFLALLGALRALPAQQREAIVLTHGEHLNPRYLGIAMDCSAEAAANHLRVATLQVRQLLGDDPDPLLNDFAAAYRRISPNLDAMRPRIRREVSRFLLPRRLRRVVIVLVLAIIAYGVWQARHALRSIIH